MPGIASKYSNQYMFIGVITIIIYIPFVNLSVNSLLIIYCLYKIRKCFKQRRNKNMTLKEHHLTGCVALFKIFFFTFTEIITNSSESLWSHEKYMRCFHWNFPEILMQPLWFFHWNHNHMFWSHHGVSCQCILRESSCTDHWHDRL